MANTIMTRKRLKHLRTICHLGGAATSPAKTEACRRNGEAGRAPKNLDMQARVFIEHVGKGFAPQIGPKLHAYIMATSKDKDVRAAANRAKSDRTLWTLTAEANSRAAAERRKRD